MTTTHLFHPGSTTNTFCHQPSPTNDRSLDWSYVDCPQCIALDEMRSKLRQVSNAMSREAVKEFIMTPVEVLMEQANDAAERAGIITRGA